MTPLATGLPGLFLLEPRVFGDDRGFFYESFNRKKFREATGFDGDFVQDNHSRSARGVLRGLHYQKAPHAQGKLVRVVLGEVFDVAVDLRKKSPTFGKCEGFVLSAENKRQLWIPPGFAHGFLTVSEVAEFLYKTTDFYHPECEVCIRFDDPVLGIPWPPSDALSLSDKDRLGIPFTGAPTFP